MRIVIFAFVLAAAGGCHHGYDTPAQCEGGDAHVVAPGSAEDAALCPESGPNGESGGWEGGWALGCGEVTWCPDGSRIVIFEGVGGQDVTCNGGGVTCEDGREAVCVWRPTFGPDGETLTGEPAYPCGN